MSLRELNNKIREFCEERNWTQFHTSKDLAIGLSTESNELLELFRFKNQDDQVALLQDTETRAEIEDELADSLFFLLRFADLNNIDLEKALTTKLEKNRSRYPVDESHSSSEKYDQ